VPGCEDDGELDALPDPDGDGDGESVGDGDQLGDGDDDMVGESGPSQRTLTTMPPGEILISAEPAWSDQTWIRRSARRPAASRPPRAPSLTSPEEERADHLTGPPAAAIVTSPASPLPRSSTPGNTTSRPAPRLGEPISVGTGRAVRDSR
jgi:hypothetical protein